MIDVAAALVFRGGKLLITQRPMSSHLGGLWEFPGGKREPGETFEAALIRELREELEIDVSVEQLVETVVHEYPEKKVNLKFFRCRWEANEPRPVGCPAFRWISAEDLPRFQFPAADAKLIDRLIKDRDLWLENTP
ncbi:MAG TPA: 8-oxo-dGTP diphosphatase MutT [Verrucomicrobiae bacterium]|nr:8-oxo-dGTP diphosphatase MutT [Verrucomicrobiae bacterium]